jgi:hypothetical protein
MFRFINDTFINKILLLFFVTTFFSKDFFFNFYLKNVYIDIFSYCFFLLIFLFFIDFKFNEWKKIYFTILLFFSFQLLIKILNNFSILPLIKQLFPIIIIYATTYYFIKKYSIKIIIDYYLKILFVVCIFGIVQSLMDNLFTFSLFQLIPGRVDSIFREPSHFALLIIPGLVYSILNFKEKIFYIIIFSINLILTFSFSGYIVFFLSIIIIFLLKQNKIIFFLFFIGFLSLMISAIFLSSKKLDNNGFLSIILKNKSLASLEYQNIESFIYNNKKNNIVDLGIYSISSNVVTAINILIQNPFGSGLGGHEEAYYLYVNKYQLFGSANESMLPKIKRHGYNSKSAHNLLIRLISEFGIFFLIIIIFIINSFIRNYRYYTTDEINIIITTLSYIIFRFIKLGGYFDYGIYFFVMSFLILIFNKKNDTTEDSN